LNASPQEAQARAARGEMPCCPAPAEIQNGSPT
jgi:hypothetical protein